MFSNNFSQKRGFTLIELIVVVGIIALLTSVIVVSLSASRLKARDGGRKFQVQEILKALELYYSDNGIYPTYGAASGTGGFLSGIQASFWGPGKYLVRLPDESDTRYWYCVSPDRKSMMVAVNTEDDKAGSDYCSVTRGTGPDFGCNTGAEPIVDAASLCASRF